MRQAIHVVIMTGGRGERLWPLSAPGRPKPFTSPLGGPALLEQVIEWALTLTSPDRLWLSGVRNHEEAILATIERRRLQGPRVLLEPVGRDTAPAIGLAALRIALLDRDAVMVVVPADHYVDGLEARTAAASAACEAAAMSGKLVTIGIRPTRPETAYGYIELGDPWGAHQQPAIHEVASFIEKPPRETAERLYRTGRHVWNSGMFAWRAEAILTALRRHRPDVAEGLDRIAQACQGLQEPAFERRWAEAVEAEFPKLPRLSIDYAVMEHVPPGATLCVLGEFPWDDLGTWTAVERVARHVPVPAVVPPMAVSVESREIFLYNADPSLRLIGYGLEGLAILAANGFVVAAPKERLASWKDLLRTLTTLGVDLDRASASIPRPVADRPLKDVVVALLEVTAARMEQPDEVRAPHVVDKPWGRELRWAAEDRYAGKIIEVRAGHALSRQYHERKTETQLYLYGEGLLELDGEEIRISPGLCRTIRPRQVHRVTAYTDLGFLEVSTPELDDVVRLEDRYGRATHPPDRPAGDALRDA